MATGEAAGIMAGASHEKRYQRSKPWESWRWRYSSGPPGCWCF